jgi:hypothetical protein
LYGCITWSVKLREEHRLRVFENRVLRRMCRSEREEVMGGWRKLYKEEHHDLYSLQNIIRVNKLRRMRWSEHVMCMGKMRNAYTIFIGQFEESNNLET